MASGGKVTKATYGVGASDRLLGGDAGIVASAVVFVGMRRIAEGPMEPDNPIDDPRHYVYRIDKPQHSGAVRGSS